MKISHYTKTVIACVVIFLAVSACKKGEDDPAFTLLSRKARVAGDWKLKEGNIALTYKDNAGVYTKLSYTFTEDNAIAHVNNKAGNETFASNLTLSCTKKGAITFSQDLGTTNVTGKGTWDFLGSDSHNKNKERITIQLQNVNTTSQYEDCFNKGEDRFTYRIKELRNKKMVLVSENELLGVNSSNISYTLSSQYTFVQ